MEKSKNEAEKTYNIELINDKKEKIKENKKKWRTGGVGATVAFALALILVGTLLVAGINMRGEIQHNILLSTQHLPTLQSEPAIGEGELSAQQIIAKVGPSVVSIDIYEQGTLVAVGSGSGVIMTEDGYVVTNNHVVADSFAVRVILQDGTGYTAKLLGTDPRNDLALLKIETTGLQAAEFAAADTVQMGNRVLAIGNAAGILPGSVTQGIVSGVGRELTMKTTEGKSVRRTLIQTDAAINPGNSGGALVNGYGQVVGINVAKLNSEEIENIGFAIPSDVVMDSAAKILAGETWPENRLLGISVVELNETNGPMTGLPAAGLCVIEISEDSSLYGNINEGDVIVAINGEQVLSSAGFSAVLAEQEAGATVELTMLRPEVQETYVVKGTLYVA